MPLDIGAHNQFVARQVRRYMTAPRARSHGWQSELRAPCMAWGGIGSQQLASNERLAIADLDRSPEERVEFQLDENAKQIESKDAQMAKLSPVEIRDM
mmetsp:Transcript_4506/g.11107  ORF Transcript_4506/g.11107 Transcript_4506/m.11107 type:complete len:98 (+) Transcript_4506:484-777(+)